MYKKQGKKPKECWDAPGGVPGHRWDLGWAGKLGELELLFGLNNENWDKREPWAPNQGTLLSPRGEGDKAIPGWA